MGWFKRRKEQGAGFTAVAESMMSRIRPAPAVRPEPVAKLTHEQEELFNEMRIAAGRLTRKAAAGGIVALVIVEHPAGDDRKGFVSGVANNGLEESIRLLLYWAGVLSARR